MATHFSSFAWRIPWAEAPGRLQSMGSQRVGHDKMWRAVQRPGMTITFTHLEFPFSQGLQPRVRCYPVPENYCFRYFVQFDHCLPQKGSQNLLLHQSCSQTAVFSGQNVAWLVPFKIGRVHIKCGFQDSLERHVEFAEFLSLSLQQGLRNGAYCGRLSPGPASLVYLTCSTPGNIEL